MNFGDLVKTIEPWKLKGIKIGTVGLLTTILGFVLFIIGFNIIGRVVLYSGMFVVFIGGGVHVYLLFKSFWHDKK